MATASTIRLGKPVIWASTRDRVARTSDRASSRPSFGLWLPITWYLLVSTRSLSSWLDHSEARGAVILDTISGSPLDRAVLGALIGVGLGILLRRGGALRNILGANKWTLALFLYMALSIAWSPFPDVSMRRFVRSFGALIMALVVLTEKDPLESVTALLRRSYCFHLPLSLISLRFFRTIGVSWSHDGREEEWTGLAMHKNNLGQVVMSSGLFFTWRVLMSSWRAVLDILLLALSLFFLRGSGTSHSSTAIINYAVGVCLLLSLRVLKKHLASATRYAAVCALAFGVLASLAFVGAEAFDEQPFAVVLTAAGRDATLTGRTGLWSDLLANGAKHPLLGVGYGAFWVGQPGFSLFPLPNWSRVTPDWRPLQGHNGYLDVYVELGLIGVGLISAVIVGALRSALELLQTDVAGGALRLTFIAATLLNNITESSLLKGTHSLWFLFLLFAINSPGLTQRAAGSIRGRPSSVPTPRLAQEHRREARVSA